MGPGIGETFIAGLVTSLSPCVLLMLPALVAVGLQRSRWCPAVVFLSMAFAYAVTTVYFEFGYANDVDLPLSPRKLKKYASYSLVGLGALYLAPWGALLDKVGVHKTRPRWVHWFDLAVAGLTGLMVSPLWSPCAGPTLGGILELAQVRETAAVAGVKLLIFAAASMMPVVALAYVATWVSGARRGRVRFHYGATVALGMSIMLLSAAVISKRDKRYEAKVLHAFPELYAWVGSF